jgi:hypothetical protein
MNTPQFAASRWSTASFGDAADTTPMELSALGEHLSLCQSLSGRLFALRCRLALVHGMIAPRFITTVVVVVVVAAMTGLVGTGLLA